MKSKTFNLFLLFLALSCFSFGAINVRAGQEDHGFTMKLRKLPSKKSSGTKTAAKAKAKKTQGKAVVVTPAPVVRTPAPVIEKPSLVLAALIPSMRTLRVTDPKSRAILAQPTAIVIDQQYLLAPLNVIWEARQVNKDILFTVEGDEVQAHFVDLEMNSGLALLHVDHPLQPSLSRSQVATLFPIEAENFANFGTKSWIRAGPRYLGFKQDGDFIRYHVETAKAGDGTGFIFNRLGQLVGFLSPQAQPDSTWIASTKSIWSLLSRENARRPSAQFELVERGRQLGEWQDRWMKTLLPNVQTFSLHSLDCKPYLASISSPALAGRIQRTELTHCQSPFPISLGGDYFAGVDVVVGKVVSQARNVASVNEDQVMRFIAEPFLTAQTNQVSLVNVMTPADCQDNQVTNRRGTQLHVKFCTAALKNEDGLNDTIIEISEATNATETSVKVVRLKAFNQTNSKKILEALIEQEGGQLMTDDRDVREDKTVVHVINNDKSALDDTFDAHTVIQSRPRVATPDEKTTSSVPAEYEATYSNQGITESIEVPVVVKPKKEKSSPKSDSGKKYRRFKKNFTRLLESNLFLAAFLICIVTIGAFAWQRTHIHKAEQGVLNEERSDAELSSEAPTSFLPTSVKPASQTEEVLRAFDQSFYRTRAQVNGDIGSDPTKN